MTKFWPDIYELLNVEIPMAYRITNPLCLSMEYLVLYVAVKKFYYHRKINFSYIIVVVLMIVRIILGGSRSPILRIITFVGILYFIFQSQDGVKPRLNFKLFLKFTVIGIIIIILMLTLLHIMGRGEEMDIMTYIFIYVGAPIVNLNTFLKKNLITFWSGFPENNLWGAHILRNLYLYLKKWFHLNVDIPDIGFFTFSNNGIELGNVYTMFYTLLYDFGYLGCFIMTVVMASYYVLTYRTIIKKRKKKRVVDLRTFFYAYLFNDLVMSFFSCRFYETVFSAVFIKFFPVVICLDWFFIEHNLLGGLIKRHEYPYRK